ncbi:hypothetical protein SM19410_14775 [Xanthomonas hortorum pv. gardneri]|nr:hypothetical protein XJ27_16380 [Xanthomonas hortorum]EGD21096.1 hypothetical protein XGA_0215 [Xanthomonas hortorum ATCC 19865]KLA95699.1 hypothetical protein SM19410_14775 [Xanthomonas hortorum pv. gardneri]KLA99340.1 hypothetical protein SM18210_16605 [Xanthomonas hortorum pv. gardneri]KLB03375.1 hypothetical protein SM17710_00705 [Xanthomonas hortorum pv. gardneri]
MRHSRFLIASFNLSGMRAEKGYHNEVVENFDGLITHHPNSNSDAHLVNGSVVGGQAPKSLLM